MKGIRKYIKTDRLKRAWKILKECYDPREVLDAYHFDSKQVRIEIKDCAGEYHIICIDEDGRVGEK